MPKKLPKKGRKLNTKLPRKGRNGKKRDLKERLLNGVEDVVTHSYTKLTDEIIDDVCSLVLEGLPTEQAIYYIGISRQTFYNWQHRGETYLDQTAEGNTPERHQDALCAKFVRKVRKAFAAWELEKVRNLNDDRKLRGWVRDITQLERRDRVHWSRREQMQIIEAPPLPDNAYL